MNQYFKTILLIVIIILISTNSYSQKTELLKDCEIISIDTNSFFPNYFIIKAMTEKGRIILMSYNETDTLKLTCEKISTNKKYDFEITRLDSIPIFKSDTMYYWVFPNIRGGNGKLREYVDDQLVIEFEDFNYKPFKPLNLVGLDYEEIDLKD